MSIIFPSRGKRLTCAKAWRQAIPAKFHETKNMYPIPKAGAMLNGKTQKTLPLKSATRQGLPYSLQPFNTAPEIRANTIRKGKELTS